MRKSILAIPVVPGLLGVVVVCESPAVVVVVFEGPAVVVVDGPAVVVVPVVVDAGLP